MKRGVLISGLFLLLSGCEYTDSDVPAADAIADETNVDGCTDLTGSWEMVSMTVTTPDTTYIQDQSQIPTLKVLNGTHWMFIRQSAEEFIFAQGGHYKLEDGKYTEIVDYSAEPDNISKQYEFECEVVGDSWYHKGDLGNMFVDEIWQRVVVPDEAM